MYVYEIMIFGPCHLQIKVRSSWHLKKLYMKLHFELLILIWVLRSACLFGPTTMQLSIWESRPPGGNGGTRHLNHLPFYINSDDALYVYNVISYLWDCGTFLFLVLIWFANPHILNSCVGCSTLAATKTSIEQSKGACMWA